MNRLLCAIACVAASFCLTAPAAHAVTYIGDAAAFGTAVPVGPASGNDRADSITVLSYINSIEMPGTFYTAPVNQTIQLVEVNYGAQAAGSLVPFVARYNGGATNNANNYTLLAKGDTLTSPGTGIATGTLANQAFTVAGVNPMLNLLAGETIVAGWFQNNTIVVFDFTTATVNDRIWASNIVGAVSPGSNFTAGNSGFNFDEAYRFNIGFNVLAAAPEPATLGLVALGGIALLRRRRSA